MDIKDIKKYALMAGCTYTTMRARLKHMFVDEAIQLGPKNMCFNQNTYIWNDEKWTIEELADWCGIPKNKLRDLLISHDVNWVVNHYGNKERIK